VPSFQLMFGKQSLCIFIFCLVIVIPSIAQQTALPSSRPGGISGTVSDVNDGIVPGAKVVLEGPLVTERRTAVAKDDRSFNFSDLTPGVQYHITISADGLADWTSPIVILNPGQHLFLTSARLKLLGSVTSVTVYASPDQIAAAQVKLEEQQRAFGFIPNFYVVYDANPSPLTAKLKFSLALKTSIDPVTFAGVAFLAGINQAADTPNYVLGAKGYGQRFGAVYAGGLTDIMFGGAILPSLLHQDPRYYYRGTGTRKSRTLHALASPFICRGDNGRWEPNYSTVGGDLISASISNAYYPTSNRGAGLVFANVAINTAERISTDLVQEFILPRFTSRTTISSGAATAYSQ
jgi:Carboxypeptidase regulatory-like domain